MFSKLRKSCLAAVLVLFLCPVCIAAEQKTEQEALRKALNGLSLPIDLTSESLQRIVEARCLNIPDTSTWDQIFDAQEAGFSASTARQLGLPGDTSKEEVSSAWSKREKLRRYRRYGLLPSATEKEFRVREKEIALRQQVWEERYRNFVPEKTIEETDKKLKPLLQEEAEIMRPYLPERAVAYGLPPTATNEQIAAVEKEEERKAMVRLFKTAPDATVAEIERVRSEKGQSACIHMAQRVLRTNSADPLLLKSKLKVLFPALEDTMRRFSSIPTRVGYSAHREMGQLRDWTLGSESSAKK